LLGQSGEPMSQHKPEVSPVPEGRSNVVTSDRFAALQQELEERSLQQTAVAELGEAALTRIDGPTLIGQACALVLDTLRADYVRVLEYLPAERQMVVRAMIGHSGPRAISEVDSEAMYAFESGEPVQFDDLASETRFDGAPVLDRLGVTSGISLRLPGRREAFGVIGAYSRTPRRFRRYELEFLQSIANVLGAAIESRRTHEQLDQSRSALVHRERLARIGSWSWSRGLRDWLWSDGLYELLRVAQRQVESSYASFLGFVHPADRPAFVAVFERAFTTPGEHDIEHRIICGDSSVRVVVSTVETQFGEDRKPLRIVGTTRDVTPMAAAQQEHVRLSALIELAAHEWRMTCDSIDAILAITDSAGTVLRINEHARRMLGLSFTEALGRPLPADVEPWATVRQLVTVVAETHLATSGSWRDPDTGASWEISARVLEHERVEEQRIIVVARDVADIEKREEIRRQGDVTDTVNHVIADIIRRGRPALQKIIFSIDGPEADLRSLSESALVRSSANELSALFADLSELVKPLRLDSEPGSLGTIVDRAVEFAARATRSRRIDLRAELAPGLPPILMNRVRLQRLVIDLLLIFAERTKSGETIRVALDAGEWDGDECLRLVISSSSQIFTAEEIHWSFEPALPRLDESIALRLSVDRRVAEEHGAIMTLANRSSDSSSLVVLRFPVMTLQV
jgi:PAS domain S-box-containing protein